MKGCCSWLEFITSVRRMWRVEYGELDSDHARVAWGRYKATPGEYVRALEAKQARIDALMLEFCPGEMTASQREEWARNQVQAPETSFAAIRPQECDR